MPRISPDTLLVLTPSGKTRVDNSIGRRSEIEFVVLSNLYNTGGLTFNQLVNDIKVPSAVLKGVINRLIGQKYIGPSDSTSMQAGAA